VLSALIKQLDVLYTTLTVVIKSLFNFIIDKMQAMVNSDRYIFLADDDADDFSLFAVSSILLSRSSLMRAYMVAVPSSLSRPDLRNSFTPNEAVFMCIILVVKK
jgi:hypothetical protein